VYNTFKDQGHEPITNLGEKFNGLLLFQASIWLIFQIMLKVTITEFLDDVVIVRALHDFNKINNVLRIKSFHDLDFRNEGSF
jgi:hypothetical protein